MNVRVLTAILFATAFLSAGAARAANSLSLGADVLLRGVSVSEREITADDLSYYDQQLKAYLITDLSKDVEATIRVQSINAWGMENSTTTFGTRYPDAQSRFWLQNAFVRLPNIWGDRIVATIGRQPIRWGDGLILSDDDLGFNALRFQLKSPWRFLPVDLDAFTAKITETLQADTDTDLHGVTLGFDRNLTRWEILGLLEKNAAPGFYEAGAETTPTLATDLERLIYGVRARVNLQDAFLKGEYYMQSGSVDRVGGQDINLDGDAYALGLGGRQNTARYGRFGAILEYAVGSGDDANTTGDDEAFRPTFASRWSGLERSGWGKYAAATFSDIRSSTSPFANADSVNDGLPPGVSGIQTIHFGIDATPWSQWTFMLDYFQYKAQKNLAGKKELGTEFDYGIEYRYSGLVTLRGTYATFDPKDAFDEFTREKASMGTFEVDLRF